MKCSFNSIFKETIRPSNFVALAAGSRAPSSFFFNIFPTSALKHHSFRLNITCKLLKPGEYVPTVPGYFFSDALASLGLLVSAMSFRDPVNVRESGELIGTMGTRSCGWGEVSGSFAREAKMMIYCFRFDPCLSLHSFLI